MCQSDIGKLLDEYWMLTSKLGTVKVDDDFLGLLDDCIQSFKQLDFEYAFGKDPEMLVESYRECQKKFAELSSQSTLWLLKGERINTHYA